jgi:hypothetical protein
VKRLFFLIGISILSFWSSAQEVSKESKLDRTVRNWQSFRTENNVSIDYRFADCDASIGYDKEVVQLKMTNNSSEKVELNYHVYLYYNGICKTCDFPQEYVYSVTLEPNQTIEGSCGLEYDSRITYFSRFIDASYKGNQQLTGFDLHGLTIKPIK